MSKDPLLDTVAAIYDAALQPEAWAPALSRVGELVRGTWTLMAAMRATGETEFISQDAKGDAGHMALFRDKFTQPDTNPSVPRLMSFQNGGMVLLEQDMSDDDWHRCALYREIYCPAGIYHGLGALVMKSDSHLIAMGVNRPKSFGRFSSRDLKLLGQTLPHLRRAMQVFLLLADAKSQNAAHLAPWDMLGFGVVLLDAAGKILWRNREATRILERADGLAIHGTCLSAANPLENAELQSVIRLAISTSQGRMGRPGAPLSISRPSLARSFALLVAPIRMERVFLHEPAAVVFITDPERESETPVSMLERLYGLTPREAALAALLLRGLDLKEAAGQLGTSMNTARTHLRLIFEKTDTHRQSELIHLFLRGPAGLT